MAAIDTLEARDLLKQLSDAKRRFLRLRFLHDSDAATAVAAGVTANAVKQWKKDPLFARAYERLLIDPILLASAELALLAPKAIGKLDEIIDGGRPSDQLRAIESVLKSKPAGILGNVNVNVSSDDAPGESYVVLLARLRKLRGLSTAGLPDPPASADVEGEYRVIADDERHV